MQGLLALMDAAAGAYGWKTYVPDFGGLRSDAQQQALYADSLAQGDGTQTAYAVGTPGHSRHEYGAAFDLHILTGGSNADGTGSDGDYARLAQLAESLALSPGLEAGYYFADRYAGSQKDPYHFQLREPLQASIDRWHAMKAAGIVKAVAIGLLFAAALIGIGR
jgi:hypothetical protein